MLLLRYPLAFSLPFAAQTSKLEKTTMTFLNAAHLTSTRVRQRL
jgi:hypothetical protein